jgi:hypothetical protein
MSAKVEMKTVRLQRAHPRLRASVIRDSVDLDILKLPVFGCTDNRSQLNDSAMPQSAILPEGARKSERSD